MERAVAILDSILGWSSCSPPSSSSAFSQRGSLPACASAAGSPGACSSGGCSFPAPCWGRRHRPCCSLPPEHSHRASRPWCGLCSNQLEHDQEQFHTRPAAGARRHFGSRGGRGLPGSLVAARCKRRAGARPARAAGHPRREGHAHGANSFGRNRGDGARRRGQPDPQPPHEPHHPVPVGVPQGVRSPAHWLYLCGAAQHCAPVPPTLHYW